MSAAALRLVTTAPSRSVVPALARREAYRLVTQPLVLLGFGLWIVNAARSVYADDGPRGSFELIDSMLSFYPGIFLIVAANLVATRDRRAGSTEMLAPLPSRAEERTLALMLASLAPALVGLLLNTVVHAYFLYDDRYHVVPGIWHIVQAPVTLVGAVLLGVMFAVWAPYRAAAVIGMVAIVLVNAWLNGRPDGMLFGPMMGWAIWGVYPDVWGGLFEGSPFWHVAYLVGLAGMAGAAAWVRVADRRTAPVAAGLAAVALALAGGIGQLP